MNIQTEKIELMKLLLNTDNPSIIQSIRQIFRKEKTSDIWDELNSEQQLEIKKGSSEIENGESSDYESFMSKHR
jgi:predicted Zn-ribbon and HTH transcriptional regulator